MRFKKLDKYEAASYKNGIFPVAEIALEDILSFSVNWLQIILMFRVLGVWIMTGSDKAESGVALSVAMEMVPKRNPTVL